MVYLGFRMLWGECATDANLVGKIVEIGEHL
jgi:hypothetical protein